MPDDMTMRAKGNGPYRLKVNASYLVDALRFLGDSVWSVAHPHRAIVGTSGDQEVLLMPMWVG